jgi:hypothetical protein
MLVEVLKRGSQTIAVLSGERFPVHDVMSCHSRGEDSKYKSNLVMSLNEVCLANAVLISNSILCTHTL